MTATVDLTTAQGVWVATTGTGTRYAIAPRERLIHRAPADGAPTAPWDHVWIPWESLEILDGTDPATLTAGTRILSWFRYIGGP